MSTRVLTLDTLAERPVIEIDHVEYGLRTADDFGLAELAQFQRLQNDLNGMQGRADLTTDEIERLAGMLDALTALVLPELPADVRGRLRDGHKLAIIQAFRAATVANQSLPSPANPPTGAA